MDAQFTVCVLVTLHMQGLFIDNTDKRLMYNRCIFPGLCRAAGVGLEVAVGVPGGLVWCSGGWLSSPDVPEGCLGGTQPGAGWLVSPRVPKQAGLKWLAPGELEGQ